jgi:hypothetical protein
VISFGRQQTIGFKENRAICDTPKQMPVEEGYSAPEKLKSEKLMISDFRVILVLVLLQNISFMGPLITQEGACSCSRLLAFRNTG